LGPVPFAPDPVPPVVPVPEPLLPPGLPGPPAPLDMLPEVEPVPVVPLPLPLLIAPPEVPAPLPDMWLPVESALALASGVTAVPEALVSVLPLQPPSRLALNVRAASITCAFFMVIGKGEKVKNEPFYTARAG